MADVMFSLVALLAFGGAGLNLAYVVRHRGRERSVIRGIQTGACGFIGVVMLLDAARITDMTNISGYLFLLGVVFILTTSIAEALVDI